MMIYRRLLSAVVVCVVMFASFGTAKAEVFDNGTYSFSFPFFNECTGEIVQFEGVFHSYVSFVETVDGDFRISQNLTARGWGVGLDSGDKYRYADNFHSSGIEDPGANRISTTWKVHSRFIGLGNTPNERIVITFKGELDEFGIFTFVRIEDITCQGD